MKTAVRRWSATMRGEFADHGHDGREELGVVDGREPVHHADRALDAHAGVDVVLLEGLVGAVLALVVLHEDVVPDLDVLAAVAARAAVGAAGVLAGVDEHFGVGAAGTGLAGGAPPVVLLRQAEDARLGDPQLAPDRGRLLVRRDVAFAGEHRHVEALGGEAELLREELVGPGDGLALEVVAERPVAEHLEEGQVGGVAHGVDVAGADALLDVGQAPAGRMVLAHEIGHERVHAGGGEEHRRIVFGHQGRARDDRMALGLEEVEVELAQGVGCHSSVSVVKNVCFSLPACAPDHQEETTVPPRFSVERDGVAPV